MSGSQVQTADFVIFENRKKHEIFFRIFNFFFSQMKLQLNSFGSYYGPTWPCSLFLGAMATWKVPKMTPKIPEKSHFGPQAPRDPLKDPHYGVNVTLIGWLFTHSNDDPVRYLPHCTFWWLFIGHLS